MSGIYDVTMAPGASTQIPALGSYAKVYSAPGGSVQVKLDGGDGFSLMEGQGVRLPDGQTFRDINVRNTSGVAQTVLLFVGDARFEDTRITGSVRIIDEVTDRIQFFVSSQSLAIVSFQTAQLIDPTQNVRGCILRSYYLAAAAGAGGGINNRLVAARSVPTSTTQPTQQHSVAANSTASTTQVVRESSFVNKFYPAGWGLWHTWTVGSVAAGTNYAEYAFELL